MYRFAPRWRRALELVRSGAIGAPRIARVGFAFKQYPETYNIRFDPAVGGGIEWDMGCYLTAMARDVFAAEPRDVAAFGHTRPGAAVTTSIEALLRFGDGRTAVTHASFDYPNPYSQVEIVGEDGWISLPGTGMRREPFTRIVMHRGEDEIFVGEREPETTRFGYADPYRLEVEHFARCVAGGAAAEHGLEDAAANLAAVLALIEAAHTGRTVAVRP
jgi:predicted dehydrogenase